MIPRPMAVKQFVAEQMSQGGIMVSKMALDRTAMIETSRFIYEIKPMVVDGVTMYLVRTGAPSPQSEKVCRAIDSHYPLLKHEMPDWIGRGMRMILRYRNGVSILTGEVMSAAIEGEGFSYELWQR